MTASSDSNVAERNVAETLQAPSQRCNASTPATATFPSEAIHSLCELKQAHQLIRGDIKRIAETFSINPSTLRAEWHYYTHPGKRRVAGHASVAKTSSNDGAGSPWGVPPSDGGNCNVSPAPQGAKKQPPSDEDFLNRLIKSLGQPKAHDIHMVLKGVPEAWDRASIGQFGMKAEGNLSRYSKSCPDLHCSIEVYRNGTIRIIIDASAQGGLDADEFMNAVFMIAQRELYPLTTRAIALSDLEVIGVHLNVDKELFGWVPKFKAITVKTLGGALLRAYPKKVNGKDCARVEGCGRPEDASLLLERMFMGTASSVDREREYRDFIYLMMREYREIRDSIDLKLGAMATATSAAAPMRGPNGAEPGHTAPTISSSPPKPLFSPNASRGDTAAPGAPRMSQPSSEPLPPPEPLPGQDQHAPQSSGPCPNLKPGAYPHHAWCGKDFQVWNGGPSIDPFPCCSPGQGPGGYGSCPYYLNLKRDGLV